MMTYSKLSKKPNIFRTFTGLTVPEFDKLFSFIETEYLKYEQERLGKRERTNAVGQGRKFSLELIDRLLMLLVYYRIYCSFTLVGFLFNLDQSNVWRDIKHLEPLVQMCIPLPEKVYRSTKKMKTIDDLMKYYPELKAFIDATEQEIPRPGNKRRRKSYYSGKKKKHTVKTQIMANKKGWILHKTNHDKGKKHDYDVFKEKHPKIPAEVEAILDSGYQGVQKDFPEMKTRIPRKKQKGKPRSKEDKRFNRKLSRERVIVENTIGRTKKFRIMADTFRNRLKRYDGISSIVYGLTNFRSMMSDGVDMSQFVA